MLEDMLCESTPEGIGQKYKQPEGVELQCLCHKPQPVSPGDMELGWLFRVVSGGSRGLSFVLHLNQSDSAACLLGWGRNSACGSGLQPRVVPAVGGGEGRLGKNERLGPQRGSGGGDMGTATPVQLGHF